MVSSKAHAAMPISKRTLAASGLISASLVAGTLGFVLNRIRLTAAHVFGLDTAQFSETDVMLDLTRLV